MNQAPQIKFYYSEVYARTIYNLVNAGHNVDTKDFQTFWSTTIEQGRALEYLFCKFEKSILSTIPKITGFAWKEFAEPIIYVYPIKGTASFSHPLTIHVRKDTKLTIGILIHELAHNNMRFEFPSAELQEQVVSTVAVIVMEKISLPTEPYILFSEKIYKQRFDKDFILLADLRRQTVKSCLDKLKHKMFTVD